MRKSKREDAAWQIGHRSREKARGSPKGTSKHDRLDIEAEGRNEEVQKGRESMTDWTLKWREATRKSKREDVVWKIGHRSGGKARGSPKGKMLRGRLDIEVERSHEEVQKGRESMADWILKRRKGTRKSKTPATLATQYSIA